MRRACGPARGGHGVFIEHTPPGALLAHTGGAVWGGDGPGWGRALPAAAARNGIRRRKRSSGRALRGNPRAVAAGTHLAWRQPAPGSTRAAMSRATVWPEPGGEVRVVR